MYAESKAATVGKEGLAAEFEKAMETAEGDDWHGFGANDVEGLFHAEKWLSYMKGLIEMKSWDKSELKKAKKELRQPIDFRFLIGRFMGRFFSRSIAPSIFGF